MKIANHVLKKLPKVAENDEGMSQMDYVHSVLGGMNKLEAFKHHFPDKIKEARDISKDDKMFAINIKKMLGTLERKNTVKKMYELAHKHAWTDFLAKKHRLYDNLYGMAMDENNSVRDRISSTKVLMDHMPKFEEDKTLTIEVKDNKAEFVDRLREMQLALHKQANGDADVIEAEIDDK